jgi:drug/metabolite transporter (DMT)-like permease
MVAILLAVLAASSWGFSAVMVRMGLRHISTTIGTLISLASGLVLTGALALLLQFREVQALSLRAVLLFGAIGVLNFPMGRFLNYLAMSRLGVGRSTPVLASAPLCAVLLAVVVTGEGLRLATVGGIALIVSGLYVTITAPAR